MNENIQTVEIDEAELVEATPELTVEEVVKDLVEALKSNEISPYAVHKIVNATLEIFEADEKKVPPQYMYNYSRNGMIAKRTAKPNYDHKYSADEVYSFVVKFTTKRISK